MAGYINGIVGQKLSVCVLFSELSTQFLLTFPTTQQLSLDKSIVQFRQLPADHYSPWAVCLF